MRLAAVDRVHGRRPMLAGEQCTRHAIGRGVMDKRFRLRRSADFKLVRGQGHSWVHPLLVLYARPNDSSHIRVGFSVSKRVGNAVARNRVKRLLRVAVRARLPELSPDRDLLFIARAPIARADFAAVLAAVTQLLERCGLYNGVQIGRAPTLHEQGPARSNDGGAQHAQSGDSAD